MQTLIKTLTGKIITLDVEPSDTYGGIKEKLRVLLGETRVFPLIFDKIVLPDEQQVNFKLLWGWPTLYYFNALPHYEAVFNREGNPSLWSFLSFPTKEEEEEEREIFQDFIYLAGWYVPQLNN
ncbi:MAG: hypothetical protein J6O41_03750 [Clostridia bacterium]|nr:hypothetical protein [Clostridia bacterium]